MKRFLKVLAKKKWMARAARVVAPEKTGGQGMGSRISNELSNAWGSVVGFF